MAAARSRRDHNTVAVSDDQTTQGWVRNYASWASAGTHLWVWCLLPVLMILSTVEAERRGCFERKLHALLKRTERVDATLKGPALRTV